jgi:hypothetical protein
LPQADRAAAAIRAAITRVLFIFQPNKLVRTILGCNRSHHPEMAAGKTFTTPTGKASASVQSNDIAKIEEG